MSRGHMRPAHLEEPMNPASTTSRQLGQGISMGPKSAAPRPLHKMPMRRRCRRSAPPLDWGISALAAARKGSHAGHRRRPLPPPPVTFGTGARCHRGRGRRQRRRIIARERVVWRLVFKGSARRHLAGRQRGLPPTRFTQGQQQHRGDAVGRAGGGADGEVTMVEGRHPHDLMAVS